MAVNYKTVRATAYGTHGPDMWNNVFHFKHIGAGEMPESDRALISSRLNQLYASERATKSVKWAALGVRIRSVETVEAQTYVYPWAGLVGQASVDPLPPQIALVTTLVNQEGNRAARYGRFFRNGYTESQSDADGRPSTALVSAELGAADALLTASTASGPLWVIASRVKPDPLNPGFMDTDPVTNVTIDNVWDTIRSRRSAYVGVRQG